jgi:hypothetical protein
MLKGFEQPQPAGTYTVETEQELLDTVTSLAYRRISTVMLLHAPNGNGRVTQVVTIDPAELDAALARDRREDMSGANTSQIGASPRAAAASSGCDVEPQVGSMTKKESKAFELSRIYRDGWTTAKKQMAAGLVDADAPSVSAVNPHLTASERDRWAKGFNDALGGRQRKTKTTTARHWWSQIAE